jgi:CubicO group peptidase (beta-lactamase class C family)
MSIYKREQPSSRTGFVRHASGVWFAIGALIALSACGGGGGGGGNPAPANPSPPPANQAPTVDAGAAQTITLPTNSVSLSGQATDAAGSTLTYAWSAAPSAGVTFATASAAATTVTFTDAGTYVLTLSVSDGSLSGTDTVEITVNPAAAGQGPVVQAGDDQTVDYPRRATLSGTATDDGPTLTYAWIAEPAAGVSFADATAASTTATFPAPGTYVLTLTASDGTSSGSDSLQVIVGPALYPAADTDADQQYGWTFASPTDVGMDDARLNEARDYAMTAGGSGVIVRYGRVVKSWGAIDTRMAVQSTTKSIGGIALGLAMDPQATAFVPVALGDLAVNRLPGFGVPPDENATTGWLDDITMLQLATHTAGFEKERRYGNGPPALGRLVDQPGTMWRYSDGALNWLADVLTNVLNQDLEQVLVQRVWNVLGVREGDDVEWRTNVSHNPTNANGIAQRELASGITINTQTMARVGLLFLRDGLWAGTQVFPNDFDDFVRTPRAENVQITIAEPADFPGATTAYGVLWWTNATGMLPDVPRDAYWAWGQGESLIVVIPSLDIVIARAGDILPSAAGRTWGETDWNGDYTVLAPFLNPVVQSVQE